MIMNRTLLLLVAFLLNPLAASANVITDWDEKAVTSFSHDLYHRWRIARWQSSSSPCLKR